MTRVAASVLVPVVLAGACSSGGTTARPQPGSGAGSSVQAVALAARKTTGAGSSRVTITANVSGSMLPGGSLTLHGAGVFDYAHRTGRLSLAVPSIGTRQGGTLTMMFVGTTLYEHIPGAALGAKPWVKIDVSNAFGGQFQNGLFSVQSPDQSLQFLTGAGNAKDEGSTTIDGVKVEHYRAEIDLAKLAQQLPSSARAMFPKFERALGGTTLPVDAFIDVQGRLRRMHISFSLNPSALASGTASPSSPSPGGKITFGEIVDLFDFGVPVHVTPPPASQVTDVTGMIGTQQGSSSG